MSDDKDEPGTMYTYRVNDASPRPIVVYVVGEKYIDIRCTEPPWKTFRISGKESIEALRDSLIAVCRTMGIPPSKEPAA